MSELLGKQSPEEQHMQADFEAAVNELTGLIDYMTKDAPEHPVQKGKQTYTTPVDDTQAPADTFSPLQRITSITISSESPRTDIELRDDYIWEVTFNMGGGAMDLLAKEPPSHISIVFWAEEVDDIGNPIMPRGFVSFTPEDEAVDIETISGATEYVQKLTRYLLNQVEPAE